MWKASRCSVHEVVAFVDTSEEQMAAFAERMRALAHWEGELDRRAVAAREAALVPVDRHR